MKTINILLVADCASIEENEKPGTATAPTPLDNSASLPYIYMMSAESYCLNEQPQPTLDAAGFQFQTVVWASTSLAAGTEYNLILQSIEPLRKGVVSPPQAVELQLEYYGGEPGETPVGQACDTYLFLATVLNLHAGPVQYDIVFSIVDSKGETFGYYSWSPLIDLSKSSLHVMTA